MRFILVPVLFLRERLHAGGFGQGTGEIGCNAGLLGNDEGFGHVVGRGWREKGALLRAAIRPDVKAAALWSPKVRWVFIRYARQ